MASKPPSLQDNRYGYQASRIIQDVAVRWSRYRWRPDAVKFHGRNGHYQTL